MRIYADEMGYYGSGGHNKTHGCTNEYKRLDSFVLGKYLPVMEQKGLKTFEGKIQWKNGGTVGMKLYPNKLELNYAIGEKRVHIHDTIHFDTVPNNYGGADRCYLVCPCCGDRYRYVYLRGGYFKCRKCAKLNYASQQISKGCDMATLRMKKFIREKFKVTESLAPIDALCYIPLRPKGMHGKTYRRLKNELVGLQNDYEREYRKTAMKIIRSAGYDTLSK